MVKNFLVAIFLVAGVLYSALSSSMTENAASTKANGLNESAQFVVAYSDKLVQRSPVHDAVAVADNMKSAESFAEKSEQVTPQTTILLLLVALIGFVVISNRSGV